MIGEDKLHRDKDRAARAEALLHSELLAEAFTMLDHEYIKAWRATHINDTNARERLHQAVQIVAKVKDHLTRVIADGRLAQRQLDDLAGKQKRFGIL
jgi:phosphatidylserine/phosphatidylglycerophosphate/cardiolipin synthase-like enzyme